jgi:hypothetical protein
MNAKAVRAAGRNAGKVAGGSGRGGHGPRRWGRRTAARTRCAYGWCAPGPVAASVRRGGACVTAAAAGFVAAVTREFAGGVPPVT